MPGAAEDLRDHRERVVGLLPCAQLDLIGQRTKLMAGQWFLEMRQDQVGGVSGPDDQAGQPLQRRRGVPSRYR